MTDILVGSALFVVLVLVLTFIVMLVRAWLLPALPVDVNIVGHDPLAAKTGERLLNILARNHIVVPAACGGAGTCGQCRVKVTAGGGSALPTEKSRLSRQDISDGLRLACQVVVRNEMTLKVPDELLNATRWECVVTSSKTVAPLIRELVLELPEGQTFTFLPGAFVQVTAPQYKLSFADFELAPEHQIAWDRLNLNALTAQSAEPVSRAYSIANTPKDGARSVVLLVRLALPPPNVSEAQPGIVSSYLFGRKTGDTVTVSGPFGDFSAQDTAREMVFIGGGVGMAPLRAIITDQLETKGTKRQMSFWYGARSRIDLFYQNEFDDLAARHDNFKWTAALSNPAPDDDWHGAKGFIHAVVFERFIKAHPAPETCEYYLCGPPMMIEAVLAVLDDAGVDPADIHNDDFGS